MSAAKTKKSTRATTVRVRVSSAGFRRTMYVNRYCLEQLDEQTIIHFGTVNAQGFVYDSFSCAISALDLARARESLLQYVAQLEVDDVRRIEPLRLPLEERRIEAVRLIHMARSDSFAEISLYAFAVQPLIVPDEEFDPEEGLPADSIALLTCNLDLQRQLILELYEEEGRE